MLDPWIARAERARRVRRRARRLLAVLATFAVVVGTAAAVTAFTGPTRSPMESRSLTSVSSPIQPGAVPGKSYCTHKAVPWMRICGGRDRMAQRSKGWLARYVPGQGPDGWSWLCPVGLPGSCRRAGASGGAAAGQPDACCGDPGQQQRAIGHLPRARCRAAADRAGAGCAPIAWRVTRRLALGTGRAT